MITYNEAKQLLSDKLRIGQRGDDDFIIVEEHTIEKPYGWIFTYTSKRLYETRNPLYAVAGNGPVVVNKYTGKLSTYFSAYSAESVGSLYEEDEKIWGLVLTDYNSLDNKRRLLLKNKLNFTYAELTGLSTQVRPCIDSGAHNRLSALQEELSAMEIGTEIILR